VCVCVCVVNFYLLQGGNRELRRIHIEGCRCNERLKAKTEGAKLLAYTGFRG